MSEHQSDVFDGYNSSPKDHDHIRRTKNSCCDIKIKADMSNFTSKTKFRDNTDNKRELICFLSTLFVKHQIDLVQCDNDADTSIVQEALSSAKDSSVDGSKY